MRLIQIGTQCQNSWVKPNGRSRVCSPETACIWDDQITLLARDFSLAGQRADGSHLVTIEQIARRLRSSIQRMNAPKLIGRYGALLPLFRLVGVHCITAFVESGQPTASPQRSPETRGLIPDPIVAGIVGAAARVPRAATRLRRRVRPAIPAVRW